MISEIYLFLSISIGIIGSIFFLSLWANSSFKNISSLVDDLVGHHKVTPTIQEEEFQQLVKRFEYPRLLLITKRCCDIVCSLFGILFLLPLWVIIPIAIKVESPGPVLSKRKRVGLNGKSFFEYRFRRKYVSHDQEKEDGASVLSPFKDVFGPQLTKVGKFLDVTSLSELPLFLNVLKGDMSLAGRGSYLDYDYKNDIYSPQEKAILLKVKPGIASLWGISADRLYEDVERASRLDLVYALNWSLWLDLKILLRVIPMTLVRVSRQ
ncbi:MAG: sugar transferase [Thermodesulfobacteriota bacterium]|jgi:lipopolysaccharide/colanic/teichoic acid biosynthesis glycosyltransferase